jgi:hypothetical protein
LASVLNSPALQLAHARSVVAVPAALTYCPSSHSVQTVQASAFLAALNVLASQLAQVRSEVAMPSLDTYSPATQSVFGAQEVAGSPS